MNKTIKRIPRPLGMTFHAMHLYQESQTKQEVINKLKEHLIGTWVSNNLMLNKRSYSIQEMATYLNMPTSSVMIYMNKHMERLGKMISGQDAGQIARVLFFQAQKLGLETASLARQQLDIQLVAQGGKYKPFISQTANAAMDNLIKASKPIIQLLEILKPTGQQGQPGLVGLQGKEGGTSTIQYITPDEGIRMISEAVPSMLQDEGLVQEKAQLLLNDGTPNIDARNQDLTAIGVKNADSGPTREVGQKRQLRQPTKSNHAIETVISPNGSTDKVGRIRDFIDDATDQDFIA